MPLPQDATRPFAGLPAATVAALQRLAVPQHWQAGDVVMRGGERVPAVLLVVSGRLRLAAAAADGHEVLFRWFGPGEFVGLAALLDAQPFVMDAVAVEAGEALHFEAGQFMALLRTDAEAALAMARIVARHAHALADLVMALSAPTLTARVLVVVRRLAAHGGVPVSDGLRLDLSQQDIALAAGASRQRVSLELRRLEAQGALRLQYRHLVVLDPPRA
jgi:CRP-like cAMP-binding protein